MFVITELGKYCLFRRTKFRPRRLVAHRSPSTLKRVITRRRLCVSHVRRTIRYRPLPKVAAEYLIHKSGAH